MILSLMAFGVIFSSVGPHLHRNLAGDTVYTSTLDANRPSTTHTVTVKCDYVTQRTPAPTVDYIKDIPITPRKPDALLTYQHHKGTPPPQQYTCSHWRTEGGFGVFKPPPKFRSLDKAEPNSQFRGKYVRNNLTRIRLSLIF